ELGCLLAGTSASCWGNNEWGQLGVGAGALAPAAIEVVHPSKTKWARVFAGEDHVCALDADNEVWCWGSDEHAQGTATLGRGQTQPCVATAPCDGEHPTQPRKELAHADDLAVGQQYTCARDGAAVRCWGENNQSLGGPIDANNIALVAGTYKQLVG